MKFTDLQLPDYILAGLEKQGFETATEIQGLTLPLIREGKDVVGLSQTGSGKTYAYGIPAIECIEGDVKAVQTLVVCPTRELVMQVSDEMRKLSSLRESAKIVPIFGGSSIERQIQAIKKGAKIIIGTPGRLMDHIERKTLKLNNVKLVVLDEADEMLNMGFREDVEMILKHTNPKRQTVMFSATMPKQIMELTKNYMYEPQVVKSLAQDDAQEFIKQYYTLCAKEMKAQTLAEVFEKVKPAISIVFCNTKRMVDLLAKILAGKDLPAVGLHGDMRQSERKRIMDKFKQQGGGILVATDVAARGIDIKNVDMVINYDLPNNTDYYIHRIGRTARAGKEGVALTLLNSKSQLKDLQELMRQTKNVIGEFSLEGCFETANSSKQPVKKEYTENKRKDRQQFGKRSEKTDKFAERKTESYNSSDENKSKFSGSSKSSYGRSDSAGSKFKSYGKSDSRTRDNSSSSHSNADGESRSFDRSSDSRSRSYGRPDGAGSKFKSYGKSDSRTRDNSSSSHSNADGESRSFDRSSDSRSMSYGRPDGAGSKFKSYGKSDSRTRDNSSSSHSNADGESRSFDRSSDSRSRSYGRPDSAGSKFKSYGKSDSRTRVSGSSSYSNADGEIRSVDRSSETKSKSYGRPDSAGSKFKSYGKSDSRTRSSGSSSYSNADGEIRSVDRSSETKSKSYGRPDSAGSKFKSYGKSNGKGSGTVRGSSSSIYSNADGESRSFDRSSDSKSKSYGRPNSTAGKFKTYGKGSGAVNRSSGSRPR